MSERSRMPAHVVVIGAGFGGLSAALDLAVRGYRVTVLEAADRAGGKAGIGEADGLRFDTGPSLLTMPEVLDGLLRTAGTSLEDQLEVRRPSPGFRYHFPDGVQLDTFHEAEATLAAVRDTLGADAADELRAFLGYSERIWNAAGPAFVYGDAPTPGNLMRRSWRELAGLRHIDPLRKMWSAIRRRVQSPHLRTLLARFATYNGSDVRRAPATLNCIAWVELGLGGFGVAGGMHAIVRVLVAQAERRGVTFRYGTRVDGLEMRGRRVTGARLAGGEVLSADAVVANADAAHVYRELLPATRRRRERTEPSMSGWTAVVASAIRDDRPAHSVVLPDGDYVNEFVDIFDLRRPPQDPTVYACAQGVTHELYDDSGTREPVFLMVNTPATSAADPADTDWSMVRDRAVHRLVSAGVIGAGEPVIWERTPAGLAARFPGSHGSIYGAASNSPWTAFQRPANRVRGIRGLYLASGSAHPGGGVPLCLLSGRAAARCLAHDVDR